MRINVTAAIAGIAAIIFSTTAGATIVQSCEHWKGGTELRCLGQKTDGNATETAAFLPRLVHAPASYTYSEWWSNCGGAGLILQHHSLTLSTTQPISFKYRLNHPNECFEIFFFNCSKDGKAIACPDLIHVDWTVH